MTDESSGGHRRFRSMVPPDLAEAYRAEGWWGDETLADRIDALAAERPGDPAIIADAGTLDWLGYRESSERLARVLVAAGLEPGARVAVLLGDSAAVHVAFVAAERAGLTVVGLGARAGERELRHLLERTGAEAIVTLAEHRGAASTELVERARPTGSTLKHVVVPLFESGGAEPVLVDGVATDPDTSADLSVRRLGPDDLFLVNSTSGTTGLPKCVAHTQNRWMYFHAKAVAHGDLAHGGLGEGEVVMGAVPAPFGFGLWTSHFTPALLGAPVVVTERFDADRALALIEEHRVTMICCVSTQFVMLLNAPTFAERDLSSLRVMFTGGEAVPYERALAFEETTGCTVLQFYGSNETGLLSGTTLEDPPERRLRTAGRVVEEMHVRLYDGGSDVTAGGRGQPACKGPATCLGYLDDPEANAQLLTDDGWMLMGDVCTIDDEGYLSVVGRTSDIIIRGGKNVSAVQVEDEVSSHPSVALAAAVARPDELFGERVCVYVELHPGTELTLPDLLDHLERRGTSKEIRPEFLVVMDQLPRSSGAKVAKGELRADLERRMADE